MGLCECMSSIVFGTPPHVAKRPRAGTPDAGDADAGDAAAAGPSGEGAGPAVADARQRRKVLPTLYDLMTAGAIESGEPVYILLDAKGQLIEDRKARPRALSGLLSDGNIFFTSGTVEFVPKQKASRRTVATHDERFHHRDMPVTMETVAAFCKDVQRAIFNKHMFPGALPTDAAPSKTLRAAPAFTFLERGGLLYSVYVAQLALQKRETDPAAAMPWGGAVRDPNPTGAALHKLPALRQQIPDGAEGPVLSAIAQPGDAAPSQVHHAVIPPSPRGTPAHAGHAAMSPADAAQEAVVPPAQGAIDHVQVAIDHVQAASATLSDAAMSPAAGDDVEEGEMMPMTPRTQTLARYSTRVAELEAQVEELRAQLSAMTPRDRDTAREEDEHVQRMIQNFVAQNKALTDRLSPPDRDGAVAWKDRAGGVVIAVLTAPPSLPSPAPDVRHAPDWDAAWAQIQRVHVVPPATPGVMRVTSRGQTIDIPDFTVSIPPGAPYLRTARALGSGSYGSVMRYDPPAPPGDLFPIAVKYVHVDDLTPASRKDNDELYAIMVLLPKETRRVETLPAHVAARATHAARSTQYDPRAWTIEVMPLAVGSLADFSENVSGRVGLAAADALAIARGVLLAAENLFAGTNGVVWFDAKLENIVYFSHVEGIHIFFSDAGAFKPRNIISTIGPTYPCPFTVRLEQNSVWHEDQTTEAAACWGAIVVLIQLFKTRLVAPFAGAPFLSGRPNLASIIDYTSVQKYNTRTQPTVAPGLVQYLVGATPYIHMFDPETKIVFEKLIRALAFSQSRKSISGAQLTFGVLRKVFSDP